MMTIRAFNSSDIPSLRHLISGYISHEKYKVEWVEGEDTSYFRLQRIPLTAAYVKRFELESEDYYLDIVKAGHSLVVCEDDVPIAIALSTVQEWNQSFWLHEFHVQENWRGRGVGRQLMDAVKDKAQAIACRTVVCETQNTNVPAIHFYRKMGFRVEAIDISLYSNDDFPDGEIALFMKCRLD
jgi:GNAT superfamily N-acetyltransferase